MSTRRLAAILAADVVGYSCLMGADEEGTLDRLKEQRRELIDPKIAERGGRIVKTTGDGLLVEFASAVDATRCAVELQRAMAERGSGMPQDRRIEIRIGIHVGDIIIDGDDIFGDGVNIAARLEGLATPGGIAISGTAHDQVRDRLPYAFEDGGEQSVKNIARPVRVYHLRVVGSGDARQATPADVPLALPDRPSIAVLPFQNMSGDPEQEYFADGMVEDIITALSRTRALFVIARNSSFAYKGTSPDIRQVGRALGVRYVLEGSVRKAAKRVRITGQLIDASSGAHIWADRFEGALDDVFDLQDQVTSRVVGAIAPAVEQAEIDRSRRKPTESLQAYDLYLRGMACTYGFSREANREALEFFERAIALDPKFGAAFGQAANCYTQRKAFGWFTDRPSEVAQADRVARRALDVHGDDPRVLANAGWALAWVVGDLEDGDAYLDRAVELDPNYAIGWIFSGSAKAYLGQSETAIAAFQRALRLSPLDPRAFLAQGGMARAHFVADRFTEASEWAAMALRQRPNFVNGLLVSMASLALAGRIDKARQAYAALEALHPQPCISGISEWLPFRDEAIFNKFAKGLRLAGMPE